MVKQILASWGIGEEKNLDWFIARFKSRCEGCDGLIQEGDTIRRCEEGGHLCSICGDDS